MVSTADMLDDIESAFDRTVNAVEDLGWDNTGSSPVDPDFDFDAGTLIEVPPGTYLFEDEHAARDLDTWGLRGTGDDPDDVVIQAPPGVSARVFQIRGDSRNVLLENFQLNQRDTWEGSLGMVVQCETHALVKDVHYAGRNPSENQGGTSKLNFYVFGPTGTGIIDGLVRDGPTRFAEYPNNPLMVFSGSSTVGTLYIRNSYFESCGEHAIYASRCEGDVRIENCFFKNNQNTHARISGEGSYVKDSVFVWDIDNVVGERDPAADDSEFDGDDAIQNTTGMTFEAGFQGFAGGLAEGCRFVDLSDAGNSGCLKVDGSHGGLTVRDCQFYVAAAQPPINIEAPGDSHMIDGQPDTPWEVNLENVHVIDEGGNRHKYDSSIRIDGRPGSVFDSIQVRTTAKDHAIRAVSDDVTVQGVSGIEGGVAGDVRGSWSSTATPERAETTWPIADGGSDPEAPSLAHEARVRAAEGVVVNYEFTATGRIALVTTGEYAAAPENEAGVGEAVAENDDGTWTATGIVARGGGDTFEFDGEITAFSHDAAEGDARLLVDGQEWTPPPEPEPEPEPTDEDLAAMAEELGFTWHGWTAMGVRYVVLTRPES